MPSSGARDYERGAGDCPRPDERNLGGRRRRGDDRQRRRRRLGVRAAPHLSLRRGDPRAHPRGVRARRPRRPRGARGGGGNHPPARRRGGRAARRGGRGVGQPRTRRLPRPDHPARARARRFGADRRWRPARAPDRRAGGERLPRRRHRGGRAGRAARAGLPPRAGAALVGAAAGLGGGAQHRRRRQPHRGFAGRRDDRLRQTR